MNRLFNFITIISFFFFSCSEKKKGELLEIPIDFRQNDLLSLSEIAEEITAIELELTDESLLSSDFQKIILSKNEVFIGRMDKIYVFGKEGKFIRTIGSKGQGPGEYLMLMDIAIDENNKRLFLASSPKLICYDFNGNFLKETIVLSRVIRDINYINEELLLLIDKNYRDFCITEILLCC